MEEFLLWGPKGKKGSMLDFINEVIKTEKLDTNQISDGYHTFGELYGHRIRLYIALHKIGFYYASNGVGKYDESDFWKSKNHSDGSSMDGWFLLGIGTENGQQITYHLPDKYWDEIDWAKIYPQAPEFDGHTSQDVLERLKNL